MDRKYFASFLLIFSCLLILKRISSFRAFVMEEEDDSIEIIYKDGSTRDIAKASDMLNISLLSRKVKKYYICYLRSENDGH